MENSKTVLYEKHVKNGGNIVPFAGYLLPTHYTGINNEHNNVRKYAGLFDVSHMGEIIVSGKKAKDFLNRVTTNNIDNLNFGQAQYSTICNHEGGIIDDLLIYREKHNFLLVVNSSNKIDVLNWLNENSSENVKINDISKDTGLLAIQGPKSRKILSSILDEKIEKLQFYHFYYTKINGFDILVSRTGYTGELGFEMFAKNIYLNDLWDLIIKKGKPHGLIPAGLGCRDTLRMEMKYCLHGNDINSETNPIEAGLGWITKFEKGSFIGLKACQRIKENIKRKLICFEMLERAIPRKNCQIFCKNQNIGVVTSGTMSPSLKKGIGIGYVKKEYSKLDQKLYIDIRGKKKEAIIVKGPFYKNGTLND